MKMLSQKLFILFVLLGILTQGCVERPSESPRIFHPPIVDNTAVSDTVSTVPYNAEYVSEVFPTFVGKYRFADSIDINPAKRDTTMYKDFLFRYSRVRYKDSLDVNGFEVIPDYNTTVKYNRYKESPLYEHYPVYFVNSTNTDKVFLGKDSYAFGIQEARGYGEYAGWQPLEGRGFDFCGNGRWGLIVRPQEFVVVLMRKYQGDFNTQVRVRFRLGETTYVSAPFLGKVNSEQFRLRDSSYLQSRLQETDGKAAAWLFYGAVPEEAEWAVKTF
jgi:hypothetical protein